MHEVSQTLPTDATELAEMVRLLQTQLDDERASSRRLASERDDALAVADKALTDLKAAKAGLMLRVLEIEKLKAQIARLRRQKFGQSSERFDQQLEQLELRLEDIESDLAEEMAVNPELAAEVERARAKSKAKPVRKALPAHLPRRRVEIPASDSQICHKCNGSMSPLGIDVTEILDYVPASWVVVRHERQKCVCKNCDAISEAPAPKLPIPRGKAGPGLLAHVLVAKYCDHIPLYRQEVIYAREEVELSRSTMSDWVGQCAWLLRPMVDLIAKQVFAAAKVHTDDTPVRALAPGLGRTRQARLWIYVRDDRYYQPDDGSSGRDPPAALFYYSPDRKGERPRSHLTEFSGFLQADGYAGYDQLYKNGSPAGPIVEVACWAHTRRKIHDVYIQRKSPTAAAGLEIIKRIYALEGDLRHRPPDARLAGRDVIRHEVKRFFAWAEASLQGLSKHDALAQAIRYATGRREALSVFLDDGRLEIDNNRAENSLRGVAIGRKNSYDHCQRSTRDKTDRPARDSLGWHRNRQRTRRPGFLDGRSNSCPGIGYPMMTVRRKASSFWLRT